MSFATTLVNREEILTFYCILVICIYVFHSKHVILTSNSIWKSGDDKVAFNGTSAQSANGVLMISEKFKLCGKKLKIKWIKTGNTPIVINRWLYTTYMDGECRVWHRHISKRDKRQHLSFSKTHITGRKCSRSQLGMHYSHIMQSDKWLLLNNIWKIFKTLTKICVF